MVIAASPVMSLKNLLYQIAAELQLPPYLDESVRQHYKALASYLAEGTLQAFSPSLYAQGSFRLGTVVRPVGSDDFDLDFICELQLPSNVSSMVVYDLVAKAIEANGVYQGKTERLPRCIRVSFADNCHVDIVPAIPAPGEWDAILIPQRDGDTWSWHATHPKGYVRWFEALREVRMLEKQASIEPLPPSQPLATKGDLRVTVQLLKRNHQIVVESQAFRTPSVVFTTITGNEVGGRDDVVAMVNQMVLALSAYGAGPSPNHVSHPAFPREIVSEKWNKQDVYEEFRAYTRTFARQWKAVLDAEGNGMDATSAALYQMFGESPVNTALKALGERTRALVDDRRIKTVSGGSLVLTELGRGNPRKNFYGDD